MVKYKKREKYLPYLYSDKFIICKFVKGEKLLCSVFQNFIIFAVPYSVTPFTSGVENKNRIPLH